MADAIIERSGMETNIRCRTITDFVKRTGCTNQRAVFAQFHCDTARIIADCMNTEIDSKVERLLRRAASRRGVVRYGTFHSLFAPEVPLAQRYATLESVAAALCEPQIADYASLLATDSGLPGADFYARFRRLHAERYYATLGADRHRKLRLAEKRQLASEERQRVYEHYRSVLAGQQPADEDDGAPSASGDPARER